MNSSPESQNRKEMIVEMSRSGMSVRDIAKNLGVSKGRIHQLLRRSEVKAELAEKQKIFLQNLKVADDLDRKWNTRQLIESLGLLTMTITALVRYYQWARLEEVSLRELMDLTIPGTTHTPENPTLINPLLGLRFVGKYGFWSVVNRLTAIDLGPRCNQEWKRRLAILQESQKYPSGRYSRSKPFLPGVGENAFNRST